MKHRMAVRAYRHEIFSRVDFVLPSNFTQRLDMMDVTKIPT